ncbi:MAG: NAD(P)/FAD-dependent oxidoreductase [Oscillospiraceae bacterium]|nr:NAD(P)/FAD-dependent oxidoreductase [Oscillospiraceae bacterium]
MYDAVVIGTGPAGLSAAINLKLHNKSLIWFGSCGFSAKVEKSEKIANYPGVGLVTGEELNRRFASHAQEMGITPLDKMVTNITAMRDRYMVLAENDIYEAKALLLCVGSVAAKGFPGEEALLGKGVSYCATCDGFLYKGKAIAVFCGAKRYEHEVAYLAELAAKVWLYTPYQDSEISMPNVERLPRPIKQVEGEGRVSGLTLTDGSIVPVDGFFCLRSAVAPATLLPGLSMDGPHIVVDRGMRTNLPGCYAAGDCTGRPYQIAKAVGEGNTAAHSMIEYLTEQGG